MDMTGLPPTGVLTRDAVAQALGLQPSTIRRWEKRGMPKLPGSKKKPLYDVEEVRLWLKGLPIPRLAA